MRRCIDQAITQKLLLEGYSKLLVIYTSIGLDVPNMSQHVILSLQRNNMRVDVPLIFFQSMSHILGLIRHIANILGIIHEL